MFGLNISQNVCGQKISLCFMQIHLSFFLPNVIVVQELYQEIILQLIFLCH